MDFNRNSRAASGAAAFALDRPDADVRAHLQHNDARLVRTKPLSIELYRRYNEVIARDPLEFAVNNYCLHDGDAYDVWRRSRLERCCAIGEAAGTHGALYAENSSEPTP